MDFQSTNGFCLLFTKISHFFIHLYIKFWLFQISLRIKITEISLLTFYYSLSSIVINDFQNRIHLQLIIFSWDFHKYFCLLCIMQMINNRDYSWKCIHMYVYTGCSKNYRFETISCAFNQWICLNKNFDKTVFSCIMFHYMLFDFCQNGVFRSIGNCLKFLDTSYV